MESNLRTGRTVTLEVKRDFDRARAINRYIVVTEQAERVLSQAKEEDILALTITIDSPPTVQEVQIISEDKPEIFYDLAFSQKNN